MFKSRLAINKNEIKNAIDLAAEIFRTKGEKLTDELIEIQRKITNPFGLLSENDVVVLISPTKEVCGTIFLVDRLLFNPSIELKGTYLSSICVSEKFRGMGLSKLLIETAISEIKKRGSAIAILIARRAVDHFYNKFNFWGVSQYNKIKIKRLQIISNSYEVKPVELDDLSVINEIYSYRYQYNYGASKRDIEFWKYIFWKSKFENNEFKSIKLDETIIGYVIYSDNNVYEIALNSDLCILEAVNLIFSESTYEDIIIHSSNENISLINLSEKDYIFEARDCMFGGHMVRIIDPFIIKTQLKQKLEKIIIKYGMHDLNYNYLSQSNNFHLNIHKGLIFINIHGNDFTYEETTALLGIKTTYNSSKFPFCFFDSFNIPLYDQI